VEGGAFLADTASFAGHIELVHGPTLGMSTTVLAFLIVVGTLLPRIPGATGGRVAGRSGERAARTGPDRHARGRTVPEGLPVPAVPAITPGDLALLLPAALGVAVVAYSDNVLTARAFAAKQRHPLDSDQELLALGAANLATGFLQGFPVSSSASRTTVGHAVGGRSQLTSVVALLAVLVVLTVGGPVLAALPTAALGALVVYAALRLVDVAELHRIGRFRRSELSIALATTTAVLLVGVLYGVLIAAGLSILDLLRRVSRPHDGVLGYVPGLAGLHDIDDYLRQRGELSESGTRRPRRRARNPLAAAEHGSSDRDRPHRRRRRAPALRRARRPRCDPGDGPGEAGPAADLRAGGLVDRIGAERIFPTLPTAVAAFRDQQGIELPPSSP
jgi:sulfate permease, SulP family